MAISTFKLLKLKLVHAHAHTFERYQKIMLIHIVLQMTFTLKTERYAKANTYKNRQRNLEN